MTLTQLLGFVALSIWSLTVIALVIYKIIREGFNMSLRGDPAQSGLSTLLSLVPSNRKALFGSLILFTPVAAIGSILWR
jgi:hypothetical protein